MKTDQSLTPMQSCRKCGPAHITMDMKNCTRSTVSWWLTLLIQKSVWYIQIINTRCTNYDRRYATYCRLITDSNFTAQFKCMTMDRDVDSMTVFLDALPCVLSLCF